MTKGGIFSPRSLTTTGPDNSFLYPQLLQGTSVMTLRLPRTYWKITDSFQQEEAGGPPEGQGQAQSCGASVLTGHRRGAS